MKRMILSLFWILLLHTAAFAQVKSYKTVVENDTMVVNASDCVDRLPKSYRMWVRYDYKTTKLCKKDAKRDGVIGKPVRAELLYEFDAPLLTYRILSKKYYDKNEKVIKEIISQIEVPK